MNPQDHSPGDIDGVVDKHYHKVYKLCLFYLRDPLEAEELLHEIFIKVLKKYSTFKGQSSIYTWIYRIAVNTAINYLNRKKVVEFISFDTLSRSHQLQPHHRPQHHPQSHPQSNGQMSAETHSHSPGDPAQLMEARQTRTLQLRQLEICLQQLSNRERTAFFFFHYQQLKHKEIAAIMKTSVSAVESLLHKAKKKIKKCVALKSPH